MFDTKILTAASSAAFGPILTWRWPEDGGSFRDILRRYPKLNLAVDMGFPDCSFALSLRPLTPASIDLSQRWVLFFLKLKIYDEWRKLHG